jgi:hypothetical protein
MSKQKIKQLMLESFEYGKNDGFKESFLKLIDEKLK